MLMGHQRPYDMAYTQDERLIVSVYKDTYSGSSPPLDPKQSCMHMGTCAKGRIRARAHKAILYKFVDMLGNLEQAMHNLSHGLYLQHCFGSRLILPLALRTTLGAFWPNLRGKIVLSNDHVLVRIELPGAIVELAPWPRAIRLVSVILSFLHSCSQVDKVSICVCVCMILGVMLLCCLPSLRHIYVLLTTDALRGWSPSWYQSNPRREHERKQKKKQPSSCPTCIQHVRQTTFQFETGLLPRHQFGGHAQEHHHPSQEAQRLPGVAVVEVLCAAVCPTNVEGMCVPKTPL